MAGHYRRWATPSAQPVTPGEKCPANRTRPDRVKLTPNRSKWVITGLADCAQCGTPDVPVEAATDGGNGRMTAFYYAPHAAPNNYQETPRMSHSGPTSFSAGGPSYLVPQSS